MRERQNKMLVTVITALPTPVILNEVKDPGDAVTIIERRKAFSLCRRE
jgi:hypothetical protein